MEGYNPYQTPNSYLDDDDEIPPLYNPKAAMWWSLLLFTPFGAWLHAKNWQALGEEELAKQNYWFVWLCFGLIIGVTILEMLTGYSVPTLSISIIPLIAWYRTLGKQQVALLNEEWEGAYERRSMLLAVLGGIGVAVVLVVILMVLEAIFGAFGLLHPKWIEQ